MNIFFNKDWKSRFAADTRDRLYYALAGSSTNSGSFCAS